ncbi:MAG TPA: ImmA/IrrE family metallo-endopeptidase [Ignavibacteriaceae bacterium]|nr:ImmA/IrrE family metallo-endopeptidase [Ignavibacteriaceae bacterium]
MKLEVDINNNLLIWAIERAGINIDEVSRTIPSFSSWLLGKKKPTVKQLEKFAQKVHLPFGYLFLENPPEEKLPIPFFRTLNSQEHKININIYDSVLMLQQRQSWLTDYLKENNYLQLNFVGKFSSNPNINDVVNDIRTTLKINEDWAKEFSTWEKAKDHLTQLIEDAGIITTFSSIVGNNTRRNIKVDDCRGFVLVDDYAPFMFINSADSKSAQMFTMAHELAHIWIGQSAGFDFRQLQPANNQTEVLCDKIAAEFLVPAKSIEDSWKTVKDIPQLARYFKVSQIVIARRLLDLGKINKNEFITFYDKYIDQDFVRSENREGGGDFYKTQRKRLSIRFLSFVNQAVKENKLLIRDAYNLTNLKGETYHTFMREHLN